MGLNTCWEYLHSLSLIGVCIQPLHPLGTLLVINISYLYIVYCKVVGYIMCANHGRAQGGGGWE